MHSPALQEHPNSKISMRGIHQRHCDVQISTVLCSGILTFQNISLRVIFKRHCNVQISTLQRSIIFKLKKSCGVDTTKTLFFKSSTLPDSRDLMIFSLWTSSKGIVMFKVALSSAFWRYTNFNKFRAGHSPKTLCTLQGSRDYWFLKL